jgi:hypothetical protein
MTPIDELATRVSEALSTNYRRVPYCNQAESLGLSKLGEDSFYAVAVGYDPKLPDVVVKVMDKRVDACWDFIEAVHDGTLVGDLFPVIHSVTEIDNIAVVLMERLLPYDRTNSVMGDAFNELLSAQFKLGTTEQNMLFTWVADIGGHRDLHAGNIMFRADGTLVVIDPISGTAERELRGYGNVDYSHTNEPVQCTSVPSDVIEGVRLGDFNQILHGYGRAIHGWHGGDILRHFNGHAGGGDVGIGHGVNFKPVEEVEDFHKRVVLQAPNLIHAMDLEARRRMEKLDRDAAHKVRKGFLKDFPWF